LTDFWTLPFSAPPAVEESFSSLLASFGMPDGTGGGGSTSGGQSGDHNGDGTGTGWDGGVYGTS
jgi:hypothetical protein